MAEQFAETYRVMSEGSVVLETVAPPEAIITAVEYPPPITEGRRLSWGCRQMQMSSTGTTRPNFSLTSVSAAPLSIISRIAR
ncbi:hypothetical protein [Bradyrhizobium lablabi]|uniref:hypothetical protein n=1 Tax=Bradyrhizobium lablabi TaxID=722472 RepID=UPI0012E3F084|nr:hypothetical protein [Bradyrhizobium lablabi]